MRLVRFGLLTLLVAALAVDVTLAWVYMDALTRPGCPQPRPLADAPAPEEHWLILQDGTRLRAWYYPSSNGAAILALGGLGGSLGDSLPPVDALLKTGFGVLQVDSLACADPPRRVTLGAREIEVARMGVDFLAQRGERVGVFGFSMGGVAAVRAAAADERIAAVIAEGGYDNLGQHITRPGEVQSLLRSVFLHTVALAYWLQTGVNPWQVSPVEAIAEISPRPVLLIYGEYELARGGGWVQFYAAGEPKSLWIVPGGDHGSNHWVAAAEYTARVVGFFQSTLGE